MRRRGLRPPSSSDLQQARPASGGRLAPGESSGHGRPDANVRPTNSPSLQQRRRAAQKRCNDSHRPHERGPSEKASAGDAASAGSLVPRRRTYRRRRRRAATALLVALAAVAVVIALLLSTGNGTDGARLVRYTIASRRVHQALPQVGVIPAGSSALPRPLLVFLHGQGPGRGIEPRPRDVQRAGAPRLAGSRCPLPLDPGG